MLPIFEFWVSRIIQIHSLASSLFNETLYLSDLSILLLVTIVGSFSLPSSMKCYDSSTMHLSLLLLMDICTASALELL